MITLSFICKVVVLLLIALSPLFGKAVLFRYLYYERIHKAKDPSEYPDLEIPFAVKTLIERFDPNIKIRISDGPLTETSAATFGSRPSYIVLSKRLFEKRTTYMEEFSTDDIMAVVAHELGHIIPKSYFMWLLWLIWSGIFAAMIWGIYTCSFNSIVTTAFLFVWLASISREEENQADSFAIVESNIPVESFAKWLLKMDHVYRQEVAPETRGSYLGKTLLKVLFNSHPTIEKRIIRVRTLYETRD